MVGAQRTTGQWSSPVLVVLPGKKCLDGEKETEDFGMGAENSCSLVESYVQVSKSLQL